MSDVDLLADLVAAGVKASGESTPRSQQSAAGLIGPSSIGFCRHKALLMMRGVPESDSLDVWPMQVGTWMHTGLREAKAEYFPNWIQDQKVTCTLPSGYEISGTPDTVVPEYNAVIDDKSKDGLERVRKEGQSQSDIFQLTIYALALIQEGTLDATKPLWLVNMYWDRSGREKRPETYSTLFTDELVAMVDSWIGDIVYANLNGVDAERDQEPPLCKRICSHYTACWGNLPTKEEPQVISSQPLVDAAELVYEGRQLEKRGKRMVDEGKDSLRDIEGVTAEHQIRWVHVNSKTGGYDRLDVVPR